MTLRKAFLQDVLENPEDDAPRLIFADWLDEHGDEDDRARAELIRIQCRLGGEGSSRELEERVRQLRGAYLGRWLGSLTGLGLSLEFRRGMVRVGLSAAKFLRENVQRILQEWFPRTGVHELILRGNVPDPAEALASPVLAGVHTLRWSGCRLGDEGIRLLAGSAHLANLKFLRLKEAGFGNVGVGYLAASSHQERLTGLEVIGRYQTGTRITLGGTRRILGEGSFPCLRDLALAYSAWGWYPKDWEVFFDLPGLARLRSLDLSGNALGDKAVRYLADCPHLAGLSHLNLGWNHLTVAGIGAVLDSPHLQNLAALAVHQNQRHPPAMQRRLQERFSRGARKGGMG